MLTKRCACCTGLIRTSYQLLQSPSIPQRCPVLIFAIPWHLPPYLQRWIVALMLLVSLAFSPIRHSAPPVSVWGTSPPPCCFCPGNLPLLVKLLSNSINAAVSCTTTAPPRLPALLLWKLHPVMLMGPLLLLRKAPPRLLPPNAALCWNTLPATAMAAAKLTATAPPPLVVLSGPLPGAAFCNSDSTPQQAQQLQLIMWQP